MIDLSIILPTIRLEKLPKLFQSFEKSFSGDHEWIIISPYILPEEIIGNRNIKYIQDWGSPLRCQQLGLMKARGKYIHRAVDDSIYLTGAMDEAMKLLKPDSFVNLKFFEGENKTHQDMGNPKFYEIKFHVQALAPYVPHHFQVANFIIIDKEDLFKVGGWDCQFETIAIGELDLSIRLQMCGFKPCLTKNVVLKCEWMPGREGDHAPLHDAFDDDMKIYKKIYSDHSCEDRVIVPFDNYKDAPEKWKRRFHD